MKTAIVVLPFYVGPELAAHNATDRDFAQVVFPGEVGLPRALLVLPEEISNEDFGHLRATVTRAAPQAGVSCTPMATSCDVVAASTAFSILGVVLFRTLVEVILSHTRRVIAVMKGAHSKMQRPVCSFVGDSVRLVESLTSPVVAVAVRVLRTQPHPTRCRHARHRRAVLVDLLPEAVHVPSSRSLARRCQEKPAISGHKKR